MSSPGPGGRNTASHIYGRKVRTGPHSVPLSKMLKRVYLLVVRRMLSGIHRPDFSCINNCTWLCKQGGSYNNSHCGPVTGTDGGLFAGNDSHLCASLSNRHNFSGFTLSHPKSFLLMPMSWLCFCSWPSCCKGHFCKHPTTLPLKLELTCEEQYRYLADYFFTS